MPQQDKYSDYIVPIEFNKHEESDMNTADERLKLILVTKGSGSLNINGKALLMKSPCILLFSPYDRIKLNEQKNLTAESFSFHPCFLNSSLNFESLRENSFSEIEDTHDRNMMNLFLNKNDSYLGHIDLPANIFLRMYEWLSIIGNEVYEKSSTTWTCRIRRYLLQILYLIDDLVYTQNKLLDGQNKSMVDICLEYIHVNYQNTITQQMLCDLVHTNRTTLNNKFREQTGKTAIEYLLEYRIKIACEALTHTGLSIAEISEAAGFQYDTYFIRQFKKIMGMSPSQYRK